MRGSRCIVYAPADEVAGPKFGCLRQELRLLCQDLGDHGPKRLRLRGASDRPPLPFFRVVDGRDVGFTFHPTHRPNADADQARDVALLVAGVAEYSLPSLCGSASVRPEGSAQRRVNSKNTSGLEVGTGVLIDASGSATGAFHATLLGTSLLGAPQVITIDGTVIGGTAGPDGRASFTGTATLDFGDGTPPLPGIQFSVTVESVLLAVDSTSLPAAAVNSGAIAIE